MSDLELVYKLFRLGKQIRIVRTDSVDKQAIGKRVRFAVLISQQAMVLSRRRVSHRRIRGELARFAVRIRASRCNVEFIRRGRGEMKRMRAITRQAELERVVG